MLIAFFVSEVPSRKSTVADSGKLRVFAVESVGSEKVEVEYFGRRYPVEVAREPLYDPENEKLRA